MDFTKSQALVAWHLQNEVATRWQVISTPQVNCHTYVHLVYVTEYLKPRYTLYMSNYITGIKSHLSVHFVYISDDVKPRYTLHMSYHITEQNVTPGYRLYRSYMSNHRYPITDVTPRHTSY